MGLRSKQIKKVLLQEANLNFAKAIQLAQQTEAIERKLPMLANTSRGATAAVNALHHKPFKKNNEKPRVSPQKYPGSQQTYKSENIRKQKSKPAPSGSYYLCGLSQHWADKRSHKRMKFNNCGKKGHLVKICRSSVNAVMNTLTKESTTGLENLNLSCLYSAHADMKPAEEIIINVQIGSASIPMLLETGAKVSILTKATWLALSSPRLEKSSVVLQTYPDQKIPVKGSFSSNASVKEHSESVIFFVVDVNNAKIFGHDMLLKFPLNCANICRKLKLPVIKPATPDINLLTVENAAREFPHLKSNKIGCVKDVKVHVTLRSGAKPAFYNARKVPFALESKVDNLLKHREDEDIIQSIERSKWAAPIVVVSKPGRDIRV